MVKQVLGYGWAGILRKYVVEPGHMWWPGTLVQVSIFRTMHEKATESGLIFVRPDRAIAIWYLIRTGLLCFTVWCSGKVLLMMPHRLCSSMQSKTLILLILVS